MPSKKPTEPDSAPRRGETWEGAFTTTNMTQMEMKALVAKMKTLGVTDAEFWPWMNHGPPPRVTSLRRPVKRA